MVFNYEETPLINTIIIFLQMEICVLLLKLVSHRVNKKWTISLNR